MEKGGEKNLYFQLTNPNKKADGKEVKVLESIGISPSELHHRQVREWIWEGRRANQK